VSNFQVNRIQSDINNDPLPNNHGTTSFGVPPKPTENLQEFFKQFNKILKKQAHLHLKNELQKE
jgi:hypothetical protein